MSYNVCRYRESDLIKLDILINAEMVEPLSTIVHRDKVIFCLSSLIWTLWTYLKYTLLHLNRDFWFTNLSDSISLAKKVGLVDWWKHKALLTIFYASLVIKRCGTVPLALKLSLQRLVHCPGFSIELYQTLVLTVLWNHSVLCFQAYSVGRALTQKLKELIPRQMFKVPIQVYICISKLLKITCWRVIFYITI